MCLCACMRACVLACVLVCACEWAAGTESHQKPLPEFAAVCGDKAEGHRHRLVTPRKSTFCSAILEEGRRSENTF